AAKVRQRGGQVTRLDEPPGVEHPRRERRVRAQEADEERRADLGREDVALDGEGIEQAEHERARQVDDEDPPGEPRTDPLADEAVDDVARHRARCAADGDEEDRHRSEHPRAARTVSNGSRAAERRNGRWSYAGRADERPEVPGRWSQRRGEPPPDSLDLALRRL